MGKGSKYTVRTVIFYVIYGLIAWLGERILPGGPYGPGLGASLLIFTPIVAAGLFLFSLIGRIAGNRAFMGPMLVNAGVAVLSVLLFFGLR